jgi:hypothetical protein
VAPICDVTPAVKGFVVSASCSSDSTEQSIKSLIVSRGPNKSNVRQPQNVLLVVKLIHRNDHRAMSYYL